MPRSESMKPLAEPRDREGCTEGVIWKELRPLWRDTATLLWHHRGKKARGTIPLLPSPPTCWCVAGVPYPANPSISWRQAGPYLSISWHWAGWVGEDSDLGSKGRCLSHSVWSGAGTSSHISKSPSHFLSTFHAFLWGRESAFTTPSPKPLASSLLFDPFIWLENKALGGYVIYLLIIPAHP